MNIRSKRFFIIVIVIICFASGFEASAQSSDLARIEYTYIPQERSENYINRFRTFVRYPIKRNDSCYFIPGIEYRNFGIRFVDPQPFEVGNLGEFQMFRLSLAYTVKLKRDWRFAISAGMEIASNFENSYISNHDLRFTGQMFFIKDRSEGEVGKPNRLILGLNYSTNAGRPFPIPLVNYFRQFHPKWSYSLGTPKTNIKYRLSEKHAFQSFITLDGFFSYLQNNLIVNQPNGGQRVADNISMTMVLGGMGYEYYFTKNLLLYVYGGHSFFNEIRLRDTQRNNLHTINDQNTFYLRTGIKFKI